MKYSEVGGEALDVSNIIEDVRYAAPNLFSHVLLLDRCERHEHPHEVSVNNTPGRVPQHSPTTSVQPEIGT